MSTEKVISREGDAHSRPQSAVAHEWQEEEKLCRFFNKLLGETVFLGAQRVEFRKKQDTLSGELLRDGVVVKTLSVKAVWLPHMKLWLSRRAYQGVPAPDSTTNPLPIVVRVGDHMVTAFLSYTTNLGGGESVVIDRCEAAPIDTFLLGLTESSTAKSQLERVIKGEGGTIVVCSAPGEGYMQRISPILGLSGGGYLGDVGDAGVRHVLATVSQRATVVVSIGTEDPSEALLQIRSLGISLQDIKFRGCVASAVLRKSCRSCAKSVSVDPSVLAAVPEYLREIPLERYAVGRGCDACGHTGYLGAVSAFAVLAQSAPLQVWYQKEGAHSDLVRAVVPQGLRPLLEEAYRCATDGYTTIEAVLRTVRSVPQVYIDHWRERSSTRRAIVMTQSPDTGGELTSASTSSASDGSEPLFPTAPKEKSPREKPVVLVVEDDEDQRSILELVLRGANYEVALAANGAEALQHVEGSLPDVIVSDLMMPVMDGSQMVALLKQSPATSQVPILMLTMVADEEREYALLNLGADDYCEKTIQRKVLLKRVENLLKRSERG